MALSLFNGFVALMLGLAWKFKLDLHSIGRESTGKRVILLVVCGSNLQCLSWLGWSCDDTQSIQYGWMLWVGQYSHSQVQCGGDYAGCLFTVSLSKFSQRDAAIIGGSVLEIQVLG